jgi:two-component system chemotaxis response regulator CheB|nr:chemotaxis protein CheB [Kofleriaceae bacterium]
MTPAIIVIGGSSGALEALLEIVTRLPDAATTPIAVVLHLMPHQPSLLREVLGRATTRPVVEIDDKLKPERGSIYVSPPDYHALIEHDGAFALSVDAPVNYSRPSIDVLLEAAAEAHGASAVGVVLSGANDDGARGLARIRAAGGIAIVQDPSTAQLATMPRAARELAGPGTRVLDVEAIARALGQLHQEATT